MFFSHTVFLFQGYELSMSIYYSKRCAIYMYMFFKAVAHFIIIFDLSQP